MSDQPTTIANDPESRLQYIRLRRLQIAATLAEWRRAFHVEGVARTMGERATLDAEDAALALEARVIGDAAVHAGVERRRRLNETTFAHLKALLAERGLQDLVAEADARAEAGLAQLGG